jgi:mono/diheme cytochrome c family protein
MRSAIMTLSKRLSPLLAALLLAGLSAGLAACKSAEEAPAAAALPLPQMPGRVFAERTCAGCHAIDRTGDSPHPDALPFRRISERYPVRNLEEAFAEGIFVGHPDMPPFQLSPEEIDDLLDYLEAIQDPV